MNKIISIDLYDRDLMVHLGGKKELKHVLKRYHDKETINYILKEVDFNSNGYTLYNSGKGVYLVWMPSIPSTSKDIGVLAHELFHAAIGIMTAIGVEPSESSEESYAYLIGYLTKKVIDEFSITLT